ncbi:hypothetical protein BaRGS_00039282, partial [Batillaria attramentaria]
LWTETTTKWLLVRTTAKCPGTLANRSETGLRDVRELKPHCPVQTDLPGMDSVTIHPCETHQHNKRSAKHPCNRKHQHSKL